MTPANLMPPDGSVLICLHQGKGVVSRLIQWQTRGRYTHASIILPNGIHIESRELKGTVIHREYMPNPGDVVDFFTVDATADQVHGIVDRALKEVGTKYDYRAVFDFLTRGRPTRESDTKWFCSEFVYALLAGVGIQLFRATEPWEVSPALLGRSPILEAYDAAAARQYFQSSQEPGRTNA